MGEALPSTIWLHSFLDDNYSSFNHSLPSFPIGTIIPSFSLTSVLSPQFSIQLIPEPISILQDCILPISSTFVYIHTNKCKEHIKSLITFSYSYHAHLCQTVDSTAFTSPFSKGQEATQLLGAFC